ncbi:MAG TPA: hypothetical protein VHB54_04460, partial [Mucilaginibacter sp.]|nr:hypothetical protein [Mucilaginibacter sp.]
MLKAKIFIGLTLILTLVLGANCFAGIELHKGAMKGGLKKGDTLVVKDNRFKTANRNFKDLWVKDAIIFRFADQKAITRDFTSTVTLKLEYLKTPGQQLPDTQTVRLSVSYSTKRGAVYKMKDSYSFSAAYWLRITILDINSPGLGSSLPAAFELGATIDINRKYNFDSRVLVKPKALIVTDGVHRAVANAPVKRFSLTRMLRSIKPSSDTVNGGNQLQLYWSHDSTADEYDIEWTTADSGSYYLHTIAKMAAGTAGTVNPDTLNRIFLNNATRVTTPDTSYLISLVSNDNYILVRMRRVQYTSDGIRLLGNWDYSLDTGYAAWKLNWYQQNLNWQYSAAYAEEGKKKEVVSYFDGTLRGRQTVTINNSDNVAVVQENVYDEFGRATASILPAPYKNPAGTTPYLHYFKNFNVNGSGSPYNSDNVRGSTSSDSCEFNPDTLNAVSGASQYYSPNNAFLTDTTSPSYKRYNFYIPSAEGYPLSVTEYTADNTGRIKLQGGVGKTFQPGDSFPSKTTKYYYGKPEQWELDQLFGNDVGYASHYLKNMVVDPNGQISISYINASGKTIATALTGPAPATMDSIPSIVPTTTQTINLLDSSKFVFNNSALKISATTTYLASVTGPASIKYSVNKLIDKFPADSLNICSNCFYNLHISVYNDCNEKVDTITRPIQVGSATAACDSTGVKTDSVSVTIPQVGEYYVTFEFDFSKTVIENYADSVITQGQAKGAIKKEFDFILPYLDSLDFKSCLSDCSTCLQVLGTQANFTTVVKSKMLALDVDSASVNGSVFNTWVTNEYNTLKAYCDSLHATCNTDTVSSSPCQKYLQPMEDDVSPGGQYALFDTNGNALDTANNVLYKHWRTQFPATSPTDTAVYNQALITLGDGTVTSAYDSTFTLKLLVQYWQTSWADRFLPYHPEYCKLQFCWNNESYELWDQTVQDSILLASQIPTIPGAPPGLHYDYNNAAWLVAADPFFKTGGAGAGMAADFENDLNNYSKNVAGYAAGSVKDLIKFVDFLLYCSDPNAKTNTLNNNTNNWDNCSPVGACRAPDREWNTYQDYYFELKQNYYNKLRLQTTCANKCTVGTPETLPTASACPAATDFVIGDYSSADGAPTDTCDSTQKLVTLNYVPGNVSTTVQVTISYAAGTDTAGLPKTFTFRKGDRNKMFCVPDSLLSQSISVQSVVCDSCQVNPLVHNTWVNDHIIQQVYNSSGTLIATKTIHIDSANLFKGTLTINANNTYNVVNSFRSYSGSWEQDSCTLSLYANNIRYTLNAVSADSLSLTHREGNTQETWYYAGTGLNVTCSSPDTMHVTALQGTNAYFKGSYPKRHLITVIAGSAGSPPPFSCINSSGGDTTSTSTYHTCLSVYTPYSTVKYQNVWVFDCLYDAVPSTCPPELLTKQSRFPDTFTSPVVGDTATVVSQSKAQLAQQADSTATSLAPSWKSALLPGLTAIGHAGDTTALVTAFTGISVLGSDLSHPYGSSSVPPGVTGPSGYADFGAAIKGITHITTFTPTLNPWLISMPYPYSPLMQGNYTTIANTNTAICNLIAKYQHQCDSVNTAHGTHLTLYQYLSQTFGNAMVISSAQLDSLQKSCSSCNFILDQPVSLPIFMTPGNTGCIVPADYTAAKSALLSAFGGSLDTTNANYQAIYKNFMNQRWGFTLNYEDYKNYEDSLITNPNKTLCNTIISVAPPTDSLACIENQLAVAVANGKTAYAVYVDSVKDAFRQSYVYTCSQPGANVQLTAKQKIYHYTLYYYDQADNLVRTIPPEGV